MRGSEGRLHRDSGAGAWGENRGLRSLNNESPIPNPQSPIPSER